jgi:hypothetical protein
VFFVTQFQKLRVTPRADGAAGTEAPRHRKVKQWDRSQAPDRLLPIAMSGCIVCCKTQFWQVNDAQPPPQPKQVELVRLLFSIGLTAFVSVGTFLLIRHLIDSPA